MPQTNTWNEVAEALCGLVVASTYINWEFAFDNERQKEVFEDRLTKARNVLNDLMGIKGCDNDV